MSDASRELISIQFPCGASTAASFPDIAHRNFSSIKDGGAEGDRTPDLRIANATLSQLSYGPDLAAIFWPPLAGGGRDYGDRPAGCQGWPRTAIGAARRRAATGQVDAKCRMK
jgi:hypothetical protein